MQSHTFTHTYIHPHSLILTHLTSPFLFTQVRLCKNGAWLQVRLDDFFPCFVEGGPAYARPQGPELWVMLIEKVCVCVCGVCVCVCVCA